MERLTHMSDGYYAVDSADCWEDQNEEYSGPAIDRLAAYERTGLEPEEIEDLELQVAALETIEIMYDGLGDPDHLRELVEAEKEGRLVVLPCKVGDTVYMPTGRWNTITGYEEDKCDGFHIARDGILQIKAQCYTGNHGTYGVPGKTVFLTREEAKAALEARKGEDHETNRV